MPVSVVFLFYLAVTCWAYTQSQNNKLVGSGAKGAASQGGSVAISSDGMTAIIGGYADNSSVGAAWIYTRANSSSYIWTQEGAKLTPSDNAGAAWFGISCALLGGKNNFAAIGGWYDNSRIGATWVFTRSNDTGWAQSGGKLVGSGYSNHGSPYYVVQGHSVAVAAEVIVVGGSGDNAGAGAAWAFSVVAGAWTQVGGKLVGTGGSLGYQGNGVAISADGLTIAVGGPDDVNGGSVGSVWIFTLGSGNVYVQQGNKFTASPAYATSSFGACLALSADGSTLAVGAYGDSTYMGAMFVFTRNSSGAWTQQGGKYFGSGGEDEPEQGTAISLSANGNVAAIGGNGDDVNIGATWIWTRNSTTNGVWSQYGNKLTGTGYSGFTVLQGDAVALSSDGSVLLIGGSGDNTNVGATWAFNDLSFALTCPCPNSTSSTVFTSCPTAIPNGTAYTPICAYGYTASASLSITCISGVLSTPAGMCTPNCASKPSLPANTLPGTCTSNFPSGFSCNLACNSTAFLSAGSLAATCQQTGNWTVVTAQCDLNLCPLPADTVSTSYSSACSSPVLGGSSCTPVCNSGYSANASLTITCQDASLSSPMGECVPADCLPPVVSLPYTQGTCDVATRSFASCTLGCATPYYPYPQSSFDLSCAYGILANISESGGYCKLAPRISNFSPAMVVNHALTLLTIIGTGFDDVINVTVADTIPCEIKLASSSPAQIVCALNLSATASSFLSPETYYNLSLITLVNRTGIPAGSIYVLGDLPSLFAIRTQATTTPYLLIGAQAIMTIVLYGGATFSSFQATSISLSVFMVGYHDSVIPSTGNATRYVDGSSTVEFDFIVPDLDALANELLAANVKFNINITIPQANWLSTLDGGSPVSTAVYVAAPQLVSVCPNDLRVDVPTTITTSAINAYDWNSTSAVYLGHLPQATMTMCILNNQYLFPADSSKNGIVVCTFDIPDNFTNSNEVDLSVTNIGLLSSASNLLFLTVVGPCKFQKLNSIASSDGSECICPVGFRDAGLAGCLPCENGFYQDQQEATTCQACPVNMDTNGTVASTSSTQCICMSTFVNISNTCWCPPGTYYSSALSACISCDVDTFSTTYSLNLLCTSCVSAVGLYRSTNGQVGANSSADCECLEVGRMTADPLTGDCACAPGTFFQAGICQPCPVDSYSDTFNLNETCVACGDFQTTDGNTGHNSSLDCSCEVSFEFDNNTDACVCGMATFYDAGIGRCSGCPVNTFSSAIGLQTSCISCATVGDYRTTTGVGNNNGTGDATHTTAASCVCETTFSTNPLTGDCDCPPGFYFNTGLGLCSACGGNSFKDGFDLSTTCVLCNTLDPYATNNGLVQATNASSCVCPSTFMNLNVSDGYGMVCGCASGSYIDTRTTACLPCPVDTYKNTSDTETSCASCSEVGAYRVTNGLLGQTSSDDCVCLPSFVVDPSTGQCSCPPGYYYDVASQRCIACPANTYVEGFGTIRPCVPCSVGSSDDRTTNNRVGVGSFAGCVCAKGYFPQGEDSLNCISCGSEFSNYASCMGSASINVTSGTNMFGIDVAPGYWLSTDADLLPTVTLPPADGRRRHQTNETDRLSLVIVKCLLPASCPGGNGTEVCASGYSGVTCGLCAHGYGRVGTACVECPSRTINIILSIAIFVVLFILCGLIVKYSRLSVKQSNIDHDLTLKKKPSRLSLHRLTSLFNALRVPAPSRRFLARGDDLTFAIKQTVTHLQILGFTGNFSDIWPTVLLKVFALPASAATTSAFTSNVAVECLTNPSLYVKTIVTMLIPLVVGAAVTVGYLLYELQKFTISSEAYTFKKDHVIAKIRQAIIVLLYILHPGIVEGVMQSMVCYRVGAKRFASQDMAVDCSSTAFQSFLIITSLYVIFYGFGLLVAVYFAMTAAIKNNSRDYQFLTNGYKNEFYYWDILVTFWKVCLAITSLFASVPLQLFFSNWLLLCAWLACHHFLPFEHATPHSLQTASVWVLVLTVSIGSLFFNGVIDPDGLGGFAVSCLLILLNFITICAFFVIGFVIKRKNGDELEGGGAVAGEKNGEVELTTLESQ